MYHNQFMQARKADQDKSRSQREAIEQDVSHLSLDVPGPERSSEEQAETVRRLKPHSRSTVQLQNIMAHAGNPESVVLDMKGKAKHKTPRWQFGIRSRNEPVDAIKCLYRALDSMGDCQWQMSPLRSKTMSYLKSAGSYPVNVKGATHIPRESSLSESPETERRSRPKTSSSNDHTNGVAGNRRDVASAEWTRDHEFESENDEDVDPHDLPSEYAPKDPWCIKVRWQKKGMSPPGALGASSAQSSKIDLVSNEGSNRRNSVLGSLSSAQGSAASFTTGDVSLTNFNDTACFVYMDLQIYVLEGDTYLVDFKSAGYESIIGERQVRNAKGVPQTEYIGSGIRKADKDVTSSQPFLDLANKLVIHLAKGAQ